MGGDDDGYEIYVDDMSYGTDTSWKRVLGIIKDLVDEDYLPKVEDPLPLAPTINPARFVCPDGQVIILLTYEELRELPIGIRIRSIGGHEITVRYEGAFNIPKGEYPNFSTWGIPEEDFA